MVMRNVSHILNYSDEHWLPPFTYLIRQPKPALVKNQIGRRLDFSRDVYLNQRAVTVGSVRTVVPMDFAKRESSSGFEKRIDLDSGDDRTVADS